MMERPNRGSDRESLPFGEPDLERLSTRLLVREAKVGGLEVRMGRLVDDVSGDSFLVGDRVLRTLRTGVEEVLSGCCKGSSLPEEFIDSAQSKSRWDAGDRVRVAFGETGEYQEELNTSTYHLRSIRQCIVYCNYCTAKEPSDE